MYKHTTNTLGASSEGNLVLGSAGGMQTSVLGPTDITICVSACVRRTDIHVALCGMMIELAKALTSLELEIRIVDMILSAL